MVCYLGHFEKKKQLMEAKNNNTLRKEDYLNMPKADLYQLAREKGVPGKSFMNKKQLIHALETYEERIDVHSSLHRMDMYEIQTIAKEKGVEHMWDMNKEELIEHIRNKEKMDESKKS
jgi:hypothetical protein